jgi:hypothetical protein
MNDGTLFVNAALSDATDAVPSLVATTGDAKMGVMLEPAWAAMLSFPRNAGQLPPTNGSRSVSTAVQTVVSNAKRFITVPPNPIRPSVYPE